MPSFEQRYAAAEEQLSQQLSQSELWCLSKAGASASSQDKQAVEGIFQTSTGKVYWLKALHEFLTKHPFLYIYQDGKQHHAVLHTQTQLLWTNQATTETMNVERATNLLSKANWLDLNKDWQLPSHEELKLFASAAHNPYRADQKYWLAALESTQSRYWLTLSGGINLDEAGFGRDGYNVGYLCAVSNAWSEKKPHDILTELLTRNWTLTTPSGQQFDPTEIAQQLGSKKLQTEIQALGYEFFILKDGGAKKTLDTSLTLTRSSLLDIDHRRCRLPLLEETFLTDPERGLWELWGSSPEFLRNQTLIARDPNKDIQRRAVAIDFGTSSTVVATENQHGNAELLRIGVRDFYQAQEPHHYENPTVLEFLDFESFVKAWPQEAYRPELDWDWVRASHEAQASFRDNPGDTEILASILPRLKQWALRDEQHQRVRLTGRKGKEMELLPHSERNPVRGQALEVSGDNSLDPVELYAWYLGMAINWRERGLFLKYYLSFPVKYPLEVKNRILASFRRGLQRSLPQSLIDHYPQVLQEFEVTGLASEPAAYAAAALPYLGIEPTVEGIPYAVFDFGGGTSDFDFGIWRWANDDEDAQGYESVFEHYASSGDNYLGGENLLEHLVYETFKQNLDELRKNRIQFTKPMDALTFPSSEPFIAATQAAQTNAVMLSAKLRAFLEEARPKLESQLKLDLINSQGKKVTSELKLDEAALDEFLRQRIWRGLLSFLHELRKVSTDFPSGEPIQVLLAGNGSRSRHLSALLENESEQWKALCQNVFTDSGPVMMIHKPLPVDMEKPYAPTSKTGVALGLLSVAPGKNILLTNSLHDQHDGEAPFAWYLGRLRRNLLAPSLTPSSHYQTWEEAGPVQAGVFYLYYSASPRTELGLHKGDPELKMQRLDLYEAAAGAKLFVRAIGPNTVELLAALELPAITDAASKTLVLE